MFRLTNFKWLHRYLDIIISLLLLLAVNLISYKFQDRITLHHGQGWDGVFYYSMAEQFAQGHFPAEQAPFVYRIGPSYVAAILDSNNIVNGFLISDIITGVLTTILLVIWFRHFFSEWWLRVLLITLFLVHWIGPVRFSYYHPVYNDPWAFVFTISGFLFLKKMIEIRSLVTLAALSVLLFVGVFFRETVGLVALSFLFIKNPLFYYNDFLNPEKKNLEFMQETFSFVFMDSSLLCSAWFRDQTSTRHRNQ